MHRAMPRGTKLANDQCAQSLALQAGGLAVSKLSRITNKSRMVVSKFLQDPQVYRAIKRSGPKPQLAPTMHKKLLFHMKIPNYFANELVQTLELLIRKKRYQAILHAEKPLQYRRPCRSSLLSPSHIERRIQ